MKTESLPTLSAHPLLRPLIRLEIQGLRGVAIISVLLFHCFDRLFSLGYLGVDVFFVISGYFMCLIMSKRQQLSLDVVLDFYFRRLKRILPTYVLVVLGVLLATVVVASNYDFPFVLREIKPTVFFYSNLPRTHVLSYFDRDSKFALFLHTWSLSVEMQFYLIVPLICCLTSLLADLHSNFRLFFLIFASVWSFLHQTLTDDVDSRHFLLTNRLWQFFLGFIAHYVYESEETKRLLNFTPKVVGRSFKINSLTVIANSMVVLLVLTLYVDFIDVQQLTRLFVCLLTSIIIALPAVESSWLILSNSLLVKLGDVSYSVYLVHWPIFSAHRFFFADSYESNQPQLPVGINLILVAIAVGFCVEKTISYVTKHLRSWVSLISFVSCVYVSIGLCSLYMYENVPETPTLSPETERAAHRMIIDLWDQRENRTELSKADVFEYNKLMTTFVPTRGYLMTFCGNKTKTIPSSYNFDSELIHAACNEKGTGRKNIVVFGNSHAVFAHAGIAHVFRDLYSELTTVFQFSCVPLPGNQQQERLTTTGKQKCVKLMEEFVKALRQWTKPIDILIILFGYNGMDDPLINKNLEAKDEGFLWMQRFYGELHSMVREVMILPQLNPFFSFLPVRLVQTKLSQNESTESVGDPRSKMKRVMPNARRHLQMIRCDRCLRVDFLTLWCTKIDDLCRVVDENGLLYFVDDHHQSLYGSLRAANYLRKFILRVHSKMRAVKPIANAFVRMPAVQPIVPTFKPTSPQIETTVGRMVGKQWTLRNDLRVNAFLGVPFADTPVGELRFEKPIPPVYTPIRETVELPIASHRSEDCLKINLFVPEGDTQNATKRPLLVFINGGGFDKGSSAPHSTKYVAEHYCSQGIVYAAVQYRVGVLGFGSDGSEEFPGNNALFDIRQALLFLREHAETVGFDRNSITIAGHSAGAALVSALTLSPLSSDLFAQAIQFSGCSFSMIATGNIVVAETNKIVKHLNPQNQSIESTKEFLRRFTAKDLTTAYKQIGPPMDGASVLRFSPRIDGDFLPMDYPDLVRNAPVKPTLNTNSHNEGVVFALFNYLESIAEVDPNNIANFDVNSFRRKVSDLFITKKIWGDRMAEGIERMVDFYVGNRTGGPAFYLDCYTRAIHDCYFTVPAKLEMLAKMRNGWPIYNGAFDRSHFAMQPPKLPINVSTHGTEYIYLFGHLKDVEALFNDADRRYREFWLRSIVQFVKTGSPQSNQTSQWRQMSEEDSGVVLRVNGEEAPKLEHNLVESEVQFWNEMSKLCDYDLIRQIPLKRKM